MAKPGSIGSNFQHVIRQAQKMQKQLADVQEGLEDKEYTGEAAGGMVKAVVNGRHETIRIDVGDDARDEELDMLLDLIAAAVNDGISKAKAEYESVTAEITGGVKIPGFV